MSDFSEGPILRGLVRVVQPRRGYRFSLDALLLADFAGRVSASHILDLGCGSGVVALVLAARRPEVRAVGLEIQPDLCEAARRGVAINGLADRLTVIEGDIREAESLLGAGCFDLVVCNPPFFAPAGGRPSPEGGRAMARHALSCDLPDVFRAARHALRPGGRLAIIYPTPGVPEMEGLRLSALRAVVPRAGRPPSRHLMEFGPARPDGPETLAPLVVHAGTGYTEELRRLLGD